MWVCFLQERAHQSLTDQNQPKPPGLSQEAEPSWRLLPARQLKANWAGDGGGAARDGMATCPQSPWRHCQVISEMHLKLKDWLPSTLWNGIPSWTYFYCSLCAVKSGTLLINLVKDSGMHKTFLLTLKPTNLPADVRLVTWFRVRGSPSLCVKSTWANISLLLSVSLLTSARSSLFFWEIHALKPCFSYRETVRSPNNPITHPWVPRPFWPMSFWRHFCLFLLCGDRRVWVSPQGAHWKNSLSKVICMSQPGWS